MTTAVKPHPVLFIHGLWIHSSAWQPWLDEFEDRGYEASAPGWPGDSASVKETRDNPEAMNNIGVEQIVEHYKKLIGAPATKPIVIGHSFGGLVAEELLADGFASAAVAIDPAGIKGGKALPLAQLRSAFPVLENPANKHRTVALTEHQFRYAFGNTLTDEESNALYAEWSIPGPGLPIFQEAGANLSRHSPTKVDTKAARGPLLLTSGTEDHVVPFKVTKEVFGLYSGNTSDTEFHVFEGRGHSLTMDAGWHEVADVALEWLARKGF